MGKKTYGGHLTCKRKYIANDGGCITVSCVDYQRHLYNSIEHQVCPPFPEWIEYYDENAKARYWFNPNTKEATWV